MIRFGSDIRIETPKIACEQEKFEGAKKTTSNEVDKEAGFDAK